MKIELTISPEVLAAVSANYVEFLRDSQRQIDSYGNGGHEAWHAIEAEIVGILQGDGQPNPQTFIPWFMTGYRITSMHGCTVTGIEAAAEVTP